jgi:hypothetical protein
MLSIETSEGLTLSFDSTELNMTSVIHVTYHSVVELWYGRIGETMGAATATARGYFGGLANRYKNAYGTAAANIRLGNLVKQWSLVFGSAVILGGFVVSVPSNPLHYGSFNWLYLLWGLFAGVIIVAAGYICGTFLVAQGQFTSALLDTAVNTSPHLQDSEKASIITL